MTEPVGRDRGGAGSPRTVLRRGSAAAVVLVAVTGAALHVGAAGAGAPPDWSGLVQLVAQAVVLALAGALLLRHPRARPVGGVLLGSAAVPGVWLVLTGLQVQGGVRGWSGQDVLALLVDACWPLLLGLPVVLLAQVYPDGPMPEPAQRRVASGGTGRGAAPSCAGAG